MKETVTRKSDSLGSRIVSRNEAAYAGMVAKASPPTTWAKNCTMAFLFGGGICLLGEVLFALYRLTGLEETLCRGLVSVTLIGIASLLTMLQVFDNIAKVAGAGTIVPITGFANSMVSPAMEFRSEGMVLGVGAKLFIVAGPVLVYGIMASVCYGVILWATSLFF